MATPTNWTTSDLVIEDFFGYTPSTPLAAVALSLFLAASLVVAAQTWRSKRRYMHTVTVTGLIEAAGYICLLLMISWTGERDIYATYVTMQVCVVMSPNLLQATDYWTVGNLLNYSPGVTNGRWWLRRRVVSIAFVGSDVAAIGIQALGTAFWASAKSSSEGTNATFRTGCVIFLIGLTIQLVCFTFFTVLAVWVRRHPQNLLAGTDSLRKLYYGLYLNIIFLYIRNIFRFIEFLQETILGKSPSPDAFVIADKQWMFYTFDTLPILICFAAFIAFHPGWYLPSKEERRQMELQAQGADLESAKVEPSPASSKGGVQLQEVEL